MLARLLHDFQFLRPSSAGIIGVDEAGRGALAGPLSIAAVFLPTVFFEQTTWGALAETLALVNDSKALSEKERSALYTAIDTWHAQGLIHRVHVFESIQTIESYNILGANILGMKRALELLFKEKSLSLPNIMPLFEGEEKNAPIILIDGITLKKLPYAHTSIVKGDQKSLAIAMASIVAKVLRDHFMIEQAHQYPQYDFTQHKGYGTKKHFLEIAQYGQSPLHRPSFCRKNEKRDQEHLYEEKTSTQGALL